MLTLSEILLLIIAALMVTIPVLICVVYRHILNEIDNIYSWLRRHDRQYSELELEMLKEYYKNKGKVK